MVKYKSGSVRAARCTRAGTPQRGVPTIITDLTTSPSRSLLLRLLKWCWNYENNRESFEGAPAFARLRRGKAGGVGRGY